MEQETCCHGVVLPVLNLSNGKQFKLVLIIKYPIIQYPLYTKVYFSSEVITQRYCYVPVEHCSCRVLFHCHRYSTGKTEASKCRLCVSNSPWRSEQRCVEAAPQEREGFTREDRSLAWRRWELRTGVAQPPWGILSASVRESSSLTQEGFRLGTSLLEPLAPSQWGWSMSYHGSTKSLTSSTLTYWIYDLNS